MYVGVGELAAGTESALKDFVARHCYSVQFDQCINQGAGSPACAKYAFINDAYKTDQDATDAIIGSARPCDYSRNDVLVYGGAAVVGAALVGFIFGTMI
jgi:hypothetical protein